ARVQRTHHLYDRLDWGIDQNPVLLERPAQLFASLGVGECRDRAVNVQQHPLGVRQADSPAAVLEVLRALEERAGQLVLLWSFLRAHALAQVLSLLLNHALADKATGCLAARRA